MNIPAAMTFKGFNDSTDANYVPGVGEIFINKDASLFKIGDGKTMIKDLNYIIDTGTYALVNSATEPAKFEPSAVAKDVIKKYKDLIASNNFDEFYEQLAGTSEFLIRDVTKMLLHAGINVREHLTTVPRCIQDMLLVKPEVDDSQIQDLGRNCSTYTKVELDAKLHEITEEFTKKMCAAIGIPANLMTIKTGEN